MEDQRVDTFQNLLILKEEKNVWNEECTFFLIKCGSYTNLRDSFERGLWATPVRKSPPHPHSTLNSAFQRSKGAVILIVGVTKTKKWQGFAKMKEAALEEIPKGSKFCRPFAVEWIAKYDNLESGEGLSFDRTQDFYNKLDDNPVNLSRNCTELEPSIGASMCKMMLEGIKEYEKERLERMMRNAPPAEHFYTAIDSNSKEETWTEFLTEVRKFGQVLFASHIGSRSYNLNVSTSDADMMVIAASPIEEILSSDPPKQTIKNKEGFEPDFTLHEVGYFAELLLSGDTRMVETLFQDPSSIVHESQEFKELKELRKRFLTKAAVRKYINEAHGPKGYRLIEFLKEKKEEESKLHKKFYILLRLLLHAEQVAQGQDLQVWFPVESQERSLLMGVRRGEYSYEVLWAMAKEKESKISQLLEMSMIPEECSIETRNLLNDWILYVRRKNFIMQPDVGTPISVDKNYLPMKGVPGDIIFLLPSGGENIVGVYVAEPNKIMTFYERPEENIQIEGKYSIYELGRFCNMVLAGNPNIIWLFFGSEPLIPSSDWTQLKDLSSSFLTQKIIHQTIGFIRTEIGMAKKKNQKYDYQKTFPAVFLLNRCLSLALEDSYENYKVTPQLEDRQALEISQKIVEKAVSIKLEYSPKFPHHMEGEPMKKWSMAIRKKYFK